MIQLTVLADSQLTREYATARVKNFRKEDVRIIGGHGGNAIIRDTAKNKNYLVGETVGQVAFLIEDSRYAKTNMLQTVTANGTTQGAATLLTQFIAKVTSASDSNNSVRTAKATEIDVTYLVINATNVSIKVWPASGDRFNDMAVDAAITILPGGSSSFIVKGIS